MHISDSKLSQVVDRFDHITARMSATTDSDEIVQLGKDYAELRPVAEGVKKLQACLLYTSPSPRDQRGSRMPSSA